MSTPQHVTKTRFAALLGVGKSYVSNLATQGRLVVNEQGLVDVEASKRLIAQTAGAPERGAVTTLQFSDARERKEHYLAEAARMDYEERCGHLLPADATVAAISAAAVTVLSDDLRDNVAAKVSPSRRDRVHVIPNFVDTEFIQPADRHTAFRRLGLKKEPISLCPQHDVL